MNWKIKMGICSVLAIVAVVLAVSATTSVEDMAISAGQMTLASETEERAIYVLKEKDGYVAIFSRDLKVNLRL